MAYIAVIEDEEPSRTDLVEFLGSAGHQVLGCADGQQLKEFIKTQSIDIVVLNVNLTTEEAFTLTKHLRREFDLSIGIILLSAQPKSQDRIVGLDAGADVFVVMPENLLEIEAQIRALERRMKHRLATALMQQSDLKTTGPWIFIPVSWTLSAPNGLSVKLTATERTFLAQLSATPGEPVSRDQILSALGKKMWDPADRSIDALVHRLQSKALKQLATRLPLSAVHGLGYAFSADLEIR